MSVTVKSTHTGGRMARPLRDDGISGGHEGTTQWNDRYISVICLGVLGVLAVGSPLLAQQADNDPATLMQKALTAYSAAMTYQSNWTYTMDRGGVVQKMAMEIKSKGRAQLYYKVSAVDKKPLPPNVDPIPEMLVVLDGKTAWFQNTSENVYFRVELPKDPKTSPLMFMPQMPAAGEVKRLPDAIEDGKSVSIIEAPNANAGKTRMEIDSATSHIKRIVSESFIAATRVLSTIQVDKETFDAEIPDSQFKHKPPKGAKEIPAPPGAAALFGPKEVGKS